MAVVTHVHDVDVHRPEYTPANTVRDNWISDLGLEQDQNKGTSTILDVGRLANADKGLVERRLLIYYDLNPFIPKSAVITAAAWWFNVIFTDATVNHTFLIQRIIRTDWVEAEATWNSYKAGSLWTTAGCAGAGADFDPAINVALGTITTSGWKSPSILSMVTDAWNNRAGVCTFRMTRNDGLTTELGRVMAGSKERLSIDGLHDPPHLRITYTLADRTFQAIIR